MDLSYKLINALTGCGHQCRKHVKEENDRLFYLTCHKSALKLIWFLFMCLMGGVQEGYELLLC